MKKSFKIAVFLFMTMYLLTLMACGDENNGPKTIEEKIAQGWRVGQAFVNGSEDIANEYAGFRLFLQLDGEGNPTSYTVQQGDAPSKPNFNSIENNGSWTLNASAATITFDGSSTVAILGEVLESQLTLEWSLPEDIDKTLPTFRYVLIPN